VTLGSNRVVFRPTGQTVPNVSIAGHNVQAAADLVYHFQPRTAKTRLFVLAGPAAVWYIPGGDAHGNFARPVFGFKQRLNPPSLTGPV